MRAVPRLCGFYPGICPTTEEKARKTLSQGSSLRRNVKNGSGSFVLSTPRQKCRVKEQQNIENSGKFFEKAQWLKEGITRRGFFFQQHPVKPKPDSTSSKHMRLAAHTNWKLAPKSFEDIKLSCIGLEFENFWAPLRASVADTDTRHLHYSGNVRTR